MKKHLVRRLLLVVLGLALGVNAYLSNARAVVGNQLPMPFGVGAAVVMSGSMEPTLSTGDLILVRRADEAKVGDIVVYEAENHLIVHRIIEMSDDSITTQGDANNVPDEPIGADRIKGIVVFHVPYVGRLLNALKTPVGVVILLALAFGLVEMSFRRERAKDDQNTEEIKAEIRRLREELENEEQRHDPQ